MKCDTSDPNSTKLGNKLFNLFITTLLNLCNCFSILFNESYANFRLLCACLIRSRIFNPELLAIMSGCM